MQELSATSRFRRTKPVSDAPRHRHRTKAKVHRLAGKRFEIRETDEPSERGIEGMERMRLVRDDTEIRVQVLYRELSAN